MSLLIPIFEGKISGNGTTSSKDDYFDLGAFGSLSPITSGKQLYLGYLILISQDKNLTFELRSNISGQSTGTTANTDLIGEGACDPTSGSVVVDFYFNGSIVNLAPLVASTGVEKLWIRTKSGTNTAATWQVFLYYTLI